MTVPARGAPVGSSPPVAGLKVGVLVAVAAAIALVAGEVTVRRVCGSKFGPRPSFYMGDHRLGWKPSSGLDHTFYGYDFSIDIQTDADGYRLGALGAVDYGKQLVVLVGDSYAFGWGVSTDETFASQLDVLLHQRSGGTVRVVNLGVGGYGMVQNCDRLAEFFRAHPHVEATVLVQHTVNDAIDNLEAVGFHLGIWETKPLNKPRSRFHLINLARYAREAWTHRVGGRNSRVPKANVPFIQDLLWSYRREDPSIEAPTRFEIEGRQINVTGSYLKELDAGILTQRGHLSSVQSELMSAALDCIHSLSAQHRAPVVHMFIATTPEWYVTEVGELARRSAQKRGCVATVPGRIPEPHEFGGSITNRHTGGHFIPQFNRFWAERTAACLNGVLATPAGEADARPVDSRY